MNHYRAKRFIVLKHLMKKYGSVLKKAKSPREFINRSLILFVIILQEKVFCW
ncbi:MAG: hypothetical protein AVDCRST_MAG96-2418 [uncultured Segetibacter sp.]|uniref:Uncharacterized protein n=1 Tax=uncultured Segetibacter sp. TaxID=481133 RepID=A0A6J4T083_9BACT|nr:MAG: hypothetical protein AVDCRST_MAG96-2418 [uncultured Segetibacter sp.]